YSLSAFLVIAGGCGRPSSSQPAPSGMAAAPQVDPQLLAFREQLRKTTDADWRRLDAGYLQLQAALSKNFVRDIDYPDYLKKLESTNADARADGMCGLAASKSPAAVDHLARALQAESDPWNRTIAVWCLRYCGHSAAKVLTTYLSGCRDIDLG